MRQWLAGIGLLILGVIIYPQAFSSGGSGLWADYPPLNIVINVPATELRLYEGTELLRVFPIAVGQQAYPTPAGKTDAIKQIVWNPWWYPPKSEWAKDEKITPPGPDNPLGPVKMPLSDDLLMHGTNEERSIGTPASHACIRMLNEDATTLAWTLQSKLTSYLDPAWLKTYSKKTRQTFWVKLPREVPVTFIYEPMEIRGDQLWLYPDIYGKIKDKKGWLAQKLNLDDPVAEVVASQWHQVRRQHLRLDLPTLQSRTKSGPARRSSPVWPAPRPARRHESW